MIVLSCVYNKNVKHFCRLPRLGNKKEYFLISLALVGDRK